MKKVVLNFRWLSFENFVVFFPRNGRAASFDTIFILRFDINWLICSDEEKYWYRTDHLVLKFGVHL